LENTYAEIYCPSSDASPPPPRRLEADRFRPAPQAPRLRSRSPSPRRRRESSIGRARYRSRSRSPPRLPSRHYEESRGRSRSPARRESFRERLSSPGRYERPSRRISSPVISLGSPPLRREVSVDRYSRRSESPGYDERSIQQSALLSYLLTLPSSSIVEDIVAEGASEMLRLASGISSIEVRSMSPPLTSSSLELTRSFSARRECNGCDSSSGRR
jgi:hypothetical protein